MNNRPKIGASRLLVAAMISGVLLGCASTPGARPEDMSAKAHEEEAARQTEEAQQHEEAYDPTATRTGIGIGGVAGSDFAASEPPFNPTEGHRTAAQKHRKHAADHSGAAEALERWEADACESIAPDSRASCPLLGSVVAAENTSSGVRISLREGTDVEAMLAHIRCHVAFANTRGREGMDRCPLYVRGIQVRQIGPAWIELSALDAASVSQLQRRVADHVAD